VLPSSCVQISAGGLNANGDGSITYQCSFANATTANQTAVNITANGLISSAWSDRCGPAVLCSSLGIALLQAHLNDTYALADQASCFL
jgi:hypothetical protein